MELLGRGLQSEHVRMAILPSMGGDGNGYPELSDLLFTAYLTSPVPVWDPAYQKQIGSSFG